ncbi:MAG: zeta toxin family protein [Marinilabiliaceae bacterium]|nr:zeta toxin family protein [Marinilabiliaceae bacterium]
MPNLYIIADCNGSGKTTASFSVLPKTLKCYIFVNADEIAKGLSPFQPETMAFSAGRIMLQRIDDLINNGNDFAFETTLSSKSYLQIIMKAKAHNYYVTLLYFWLKTPQLAIERIKERVAAGGHNISDEIVIRRYHRGLYNFKNFYIQICDNWFLFDNTTNPFEIIAEGKKEKINVKHNILWNQIKLMI